MHNLFGAAHVGDMAHGCASNVPMPSASVSQDRTYRRDLTGVCAREAEPKQLIQIPHRVREMTQQ